MARGRMVNKKISNSKRVNDLPLPAQLLYTWLIPHLDCNGVFFGSPQMVKSLVFPRKSITAREIGRWLGMMETSVDDDKIPLIKRFQVDGEVFLFMPGFEGEQVNLRKDKEKPEYPLPPVTFRQMYGGITETFRQNDGVREEKRIEYKENKKITTTPLPLIPSPPPPISLIPSPPPPISLIPSPPPPTGELLLSAGEEGVKKEKTVYEVYSEEIGKITEISKNTLVDAVEHFGEEWVRDAIKVSVLQGHPKWPYIAKILDNWATYGRDAGKPSNSDAGVGIGGEKSRDPEKYFKGTYGHMVAGLKKT